MSDSMRPYSAWWATSVHGIPQAKNTGVSCCALLQGSSQPRDQIHVSYVSCIGRRVITSVAWEASLSLSFLKYKMKILFVSVLMCQ